MKRICMVLILAVLLAVPADAVIRWVDFDLSYETMERALELSEEAMEQENPQSWIRILALASAYSGGNPKPTDAVLACSALMAGKTPEEYLGGNDKLFHYYLEAYDAALGGIVGNYAVQVDGHWKPAYGVKAFSPVAAGYAYSHSDDFGVSRSYGFRRRHLGHDMIGSLGTPVVAVESGEVEALGWNQYGGWRIGIRSKDRKRYYYYAHLRKDAPFAPGLKEGDWVEAGQVIGFMGRTGYSVRENVNNIEAVHLHFGMQLIFEESQKECDSEIWIDVYDIVRLLERHKSTVIYNSTTDCWERLYPFVDLDGKPLG